MSLGFREFRVQEDDVLPASPLGALTKTFK